MKKAYLISGLVSIFISLIIYFTKGDPYEVWTHWGAAIKETYLLHLFWSLIFMFLGIKLIFKGLN